MVTNISERSFASFLTQKQLLPIHQTAGVTDRWICTALHLKCYFLIVQISLSFSEKFTTEFSAFRLVLDVSERNKGGVIIMSENEGAYQKWYFEEDQTIRSELGLVMDVKFYSKENGSTVIAYSKHGQNNQKFRILPVAE